MVVALLDRPKYVSVSGTPEDCPETTATPVLKYRRQKMIRVPMTPPVARAAEVLRIHGPQDPDDAVPSIGDIQISCIIKR